MVRLSQLRSKVTVSLQRPNLGVLPMQITVEHVGTVPALVPLVLAARNSLPSVEAHP